MEKKPLRIWDNNTLIGEVQKGRTLKLVLYAAVRDGVRYVNIREFYLNTKTDTWKPGRNGITIPLVIPIEKATIILEPGKAFTDMLAKTIEVASTMELEDPENAVYGLSEEEKAKRAKEREEYKEHYSKCKK